MSLPTYCGAVPLVRAGPPGLGFGPEIDIRFDSKMPTRASAADPGVRPTVSGGGTRL